MVTSKNTIIESLQEKSGLLSEFLELKQKIGKVLLENYPQPLALGMTWYTYRNQDTLEIGSGYTELVLYDEDVNEKYDFIISMELARDLINLGVIKFSDISWNDNDVFLYEVDIKQFL